MADEKITIRKNLLTDLLKVYHHPNFGFAGLALKETMEKIEEAVNMTRKIENSKRWKW